MEFHASSIFRRTLGTAGKTITFDPSDDQAAADPRIPCRARPNPEEPAVCCRHSCCFDHEVNRSAAYVDCGGNAPRLSGFDPVSTAATSAAHSSSCSRPHSLRSRSAQSFAFWQMLTSRRATSSASFARGKSTGEVTFLALGRPNMRHRVRAGRIAVAWPAVLVRPRMPAADDETAV
jgi:hypothetical protein